jgi:hypothetical protein
MRRWSFPLVLAATLAAGWLACTGALAQVQTQADAARIERFDGATIAGGKKLRVTIQTWLIPDRTKIQALELPAAGLTVAELRGGSLVTIIQNQRQVRHAGEFWTVPPGVKMGLETEDSSAALQTTVIAP